MIRFRQWLAGVMLICAAGTASAEDVAQRAPAPLYGNAEISRIDEALRTAQAARSAGDSETAARVLADALPQAPNDPRLLGEYGKALVGTGHYDDALEYLHRALKLTPDDWKLLVAEGVAYDEKGDYRRAQTAYAGALKLKPGDPAILSDSAISHVRAGDPDGAKELLALAAQHGASAAAVARIQGMIPSGKAPRVAAVAAAGLAGNADPPAVRPQCHFYILAGAFAVAANAEKAAASLKNFKAHLGQIRRNGKTLYAVTLGPFSTRAEAEDARRHVKVLGGIDAQVLAR